MSDKPPNCTRVDRWNLVQQGFKFITSNEFNRQKDHINNKLYPIIAKIMGQVSKSNIYWALDEYLKPFIHKDHMRALLITWKNMDDNIFEVAKEDERKRISPEEIGKFIYLLNILSDEGIYLTSIPTASSKSVKLTTPEPEWFKEYMKINESVDPDKETWREKYITSSVDWAKSVFDEGKKKITETAISGAWGAAAGMMGTSLGAAKVVNSETRLHTAIRLEGFKEALAYWYNDEGKELYDLWKAFRHSSKIALKFLINDPVTKLYYSIPKKDKKKFEKDAEDLCNHWDRLPVNILKVDKDDTYKFLEKHNRDKLIELFRNIKVFVEKWSHEINSAKSSSSRSRSRKSVSSRSRSRKSVSSRSRSRKSVSSSSRKSVRGGSLKTKITSRKRKGRRSKTRKKNK